MVATGVVCLSLAGAPVGSKDLGQQTPGTSGEAPVSAPSVTLAPTIHPPLPADPSEYWLVPTVRLKPDTTKTDAADIARTDALKRDTAKRESSLAAFARGVTLFVEGNYTAALPLVSDPSLASTALADYARYYTGFTQLRLERINDAVKTFESLDRHKPVGYLTEAVALRRSEAEMAEKDADDALRVLERLAREKVTSPEDLLMRMARAAERAGDPDRAALTYRRIYFEFPLSADADLAAQELARLERTPLLTPDRFKLELGRAERLFGARRYQPARDAYERLARVAGGDDKELVALRLAESDYYLGRYRASRDALRPYLTGAAREAEARFFHLTAVRALGDTETYVALSRGLVNDFPKESWTEETLNNLASHYIKEDQDEDADLVLRDLYDRFPRGRYGERAAWKVGWHAYRNSRLDETVRYFEEAAASFPRADTRPAWLYWSGRAHEQLGHAADATARYRLAATDYFNSYYGRLAVKQLGSLFERNAERIEGALLTAESDEDPRLAQNDLTIRELISLGLYDDAQREVQYAQRVWGDSAALQATAAWIRHQQGRAALTARERFDSLRGAINAMKRAYPQYIAAGGEDLPAEVLGIVFPLDYWPLIKKHSEANDLDPYLMAALVQQESTFTAEIRSSANAVGLMQLLPSTGRRYARALKIPYNSRTLTQPETNIRLGMAYFKDLIDRFGGAHFAIASYNAGETRIARWRAEKPDVPQDEFIDDIPFPETQNYVKKILSMAEDYRRLYGGGLLDPESGAGKASESRGAGKTGNVSGAGKAGKAPPARPTRRK